MKDVVNTLASNHDDPAKPTEQVSLEGNSQNIMDELELFEISAIKVEKECAENDLIKIEGEFKNPKFKPWTKVNPEEDVKIMWEAIKNESDKKGIEEIGEASATFEHCLEFWGT